MIDPFYGTEPRHALSPYVSDCALSVMHTRPISGWTEIEGSLAFFDVSRFTTLTERLARLGRTGAEYINDVLNIVFKGLIEEVFKVEGDVLEFGGDAMVVLFTGDGHERRAAIGAARMLRLMAREGSIVTPVGEVRLRMSCGIASGSQAYHLVGSTRKTLMVAGPISSAMARLQSAADPGEVLVNDRLASAVSSSWVDRARNDGAFALLLARIPSGDLPTVSRRRHLADDADIAELLPTQFRSLVDVYNRPGELKQVAMAFIRLDGTDDILAAEGTDALNSRLREITAIVDLAAAQHDVCWLETQAEANSVRWTLIAGAPNATERDGERMVRVLRRIADETPLPLRIGANLGVVFVGDMGHPQRCTYIAIGDATNLAARLMAQAGPGEILAGERLAATCVSRFESTALEPFFVKGKKDTVRAFSIGRFVDDDRGALDDPDDQLPAMLGRDDELAQLLRVVGGGGIVDLVGEAGSGKSRLWHEARRVDTSRRWLVMNAEPHEVDSPFLPVRRLIRAAAGIGSRDDAASAGRTLAAFVQRTATSLVPWIPLVADLIGATVPAADEVEALDPAFRAERLTAATAELIVALAGDDSVVVVEDSHWIDEASRGLLDLLCRMPDRRAAMVLTRRPDGRAPSPATTIALEPIDDDSADQLLLSELPASDASDATLTRLRSSASGNPLYLIELARAVARSASQPSTTSHSSTATQSGNAYPESVERLLAARVDQLPVSGRELIRDASVLGSTMSRALASRVLTRRDLAEADTWERELGDLMIVDADSVRFRHDLVRVAAYEGLSVRRRRAIHQRAGEVIEEWGDSVPIADPVAALAFHAAGSGLPERIVRWSGEAAEAAITKGAMEIAESLLGDVVDAQQRVGVGAAARCATSRRLAFAAERAGHPDVALEALGEAAKLADDRERALIAVDRARLLEKLGKYQAALVTTARALRSCPDPDVSGTLLLSRATLRNFQGRWRECLDLCQTILDDIEHSDDKRLLAQAHLLAEWCCTSLGLPERAAHERAALDLLTELDDSIGLANLFLNRGVSAWPENRALDAVADFRTSSERYARAVDVLGAALADNNLAEILTLQFHLDAAEALLERARRVAQAANYPHGTFTTISGLSRIAAWRGRTGEAHQLQSQALNGFRKLRADDLVADSLIRLVEIHVIAGEDEALAVADEAAAALRRLGDVRVLPATLARLRARALLLVGRTDEARESFERALDLAAGESFTYEVALASLGIARIDGDDERVATAIGLLGELGVLAPPPGS